MASKILNALRKPGARTEVQVSAPSHIVYHAKSEKEHHAPAETTDTYAILVKERRLDRWLDYVVQLSGSEYAYATILIGLFVWAFLGIPYGTASMYPIIISDAQAIINLVFDAFLMRQQFNQHDNLLMVAGCLRSRICSHKRMIEQLTAAGSLTRIDAAKFQTLAQDDDDQLPPESRLTKLSSAISSFLGHFGTVIDFWCCIAIWLAFGPYCKWSSTWQLYINSATSALMILLLAFLANVRERHSRYATECLKAIWKADSKLESKLRQLSGDEIENPVVVLPKQDQGPVQRAIDYYADLVGTLIGLAILIVVILAWVACGPAMHFNSNWWLMMGTYAGLVGLNDGFVLRNICEVFGQYEDEQFNAVELEDQATLNVIGVDTFGEKYQVKQSISYRISVRVGYVCSHRYMTVAGVVLIIGLIAGASALLWDETGQLLCNIPPSIIESFFTLSLITGHNVGEKKRRVDLSNIHQRRLKLLSYVNSQQFEKATQQVKDEPVRAETPETPNVVEKDVCYVS